MKINSNLEMNGNQLILGRAEMVSDFPNDKLFEGRLIYHSLDKKYYYYDGNNWIVIPLDKFPGYSYFDPDDDNTKQITRYSMPNSLVSGDKAVDEKLHNNCVVTSAEIANTLMNLRYFSDPTCDPSVNHWGYPVYNKNGQLDFIDTSKITSEYNNIETTKEKSLIPKIEADGTVTSYPFIVDTSQNDFTSNKEWTDKAIPTSGCVLKNIKNLEERIIDFENNEISNEEIDSLF